MVSLELKGELQLNILAALMQAYRLSLLMNMRDIVLISLIAVKEKLPHFGGSRRMAYIPSRRYALWDKIEL